MRKILLVCIGIVMAGVLVSCSVQYEMSGLKKLEFRHPANWKIVETKDDYTYDYVFNFESQEAAFEVYLRTIYVSFESPMQWLRRKRKTAAGKGYYASRISRFSTKSFKWHLMETEDIVRQGKEDFTISIRHYIAKEEKSPRMVQCFIVGQRNSLDKLPADAVNKFLESIALKPLKVKKKDISLYENYVSSAAVAVFLLRGQKLSEKAEFDRAIAVFNSLLKRPITDKLKAKLNVSLSSCFLEKGMKPYIETKDTRDFNLAIQAAEQAIKAQKQYWQAYFNIGIANLNMGEFTKAKKSFNQALKYCPDTVPEYKVIEFYYDEAKAPLRYKRSISKMFLKENRVTGFVYGEKDPLVIISNKLYRVGEVVSGYTILKITRDKAYMSLGLRLDEFVLGDLILQPQVSPLQIKPE